MEHFKLPLKFDNLYEDEDNDFGFGITSLDYGSAVDFPTMSDQLEDFADISNPLESADLSDGAVNNIFFWSIKEFERLNPDMKNQVFTVLQDLVRYILQNSYEGLNATKKNNAKKSMYYFMQLILKAEHTHGIGSKGDLGLLSGEGGSTKASTGRKGKSSSSSAFDWIECRRNCLETLHEIVAFKLSYFWTMGLVEETFTTTIWRYCLDLLESKPVGIAGNGFNESNSRSLCVLIIGKSIGHFGNSLTSGSYAALANACIDCIKKAEHMSNIIAEIIHQESVLHHSQLIAREITTEIVKMHQGNAANQSAQGIKNIGLFLESFAKVDTAVFSQYMPILVKLIDEQAYHLRNGMINSISHVIEYIHVCLTKPQPQPGVDDMTNEQQIEDAETLQRNMDSLARQRDSLLNMLIERTHDVNPHARCAILKVWTMLIDNHAVPAKRVGAVSEVGVDRLYDKNAFVRRNAIALLTTILDNNPFSGTLDKELFKIQKDELEKMIANRMEELSENAGAPVELDGEEDGATTLPITNNKMPLKRKRDSRGEEVDDDEEEEEDDGVDEEELLKDANNDEAIIEYNNKLEYVTSALEFIQAIDTAIGKISTLLESKNATDVVESMRFFNRAVNFGITGALDRFKEAFKLIWHQDATIRTELLSSFTQVFLTDGARENAKSCPPNEIAINLMRLIQKCSSNELISLEAIVAEVIISESTNVEKVVTCLLEKAMTYQKAVSSGPRKSSLVNGLPVSDEEAATGGVVSDLAAALYAITMIFNKITPTTKDIISVNTLNNMIHCGLGKISIDTKDYYAMKVAGACLQKIFPIYQETVEEERRSIISDNVFAYAMDCLVKVIRLPLDTTTYHAVSHWFAACEEAIHALYKLHPNPDEVLASIIKYYYARISSNDNCPSETLAAFLFILGQCALNTVVYTEQLATEVKKKLRIQVENGTINSKTGKAGVMSSNTNEEKKTGTEGAIEDFDEQMGVQQQIDADHDQEVTILIERELIVDMNNLLSQFRDLIIFIVANDSNAFSDPILRSAAVMALCRYMSISSEVCENCLPLLFTVLERDTSVTIKTSIMVALGDLAFRFPNTLEPWTNMMFSRLRDNDVIVRYNTLMVITHLVLNDMIKVKGHVKHVVMSLNDDEISIRDLARLFFIKLSERSNNPIYNLFADIISQFSRDYEDDERDKKLNNTKNNKNKKKILETITEEMEVEDETNGDNDEVSSTIGGMTTTTTSNSNSVLPGSDERLVLTTEQFQQTFHFLFSFVQKDKQSDSLFERLLQRLCAAETIRQRQNLAFCIAELTVTEKGLKKLIEHAKNLKLALQDDKVFEYFEIVLQKAKKSRSGGATGTSSANAGNAASQENGEGTTGPVAPTVAINKTVVEEAERVLLAVANNEEIGGISFGADAKDGDNISVATGDDASTATGATGKTAGNKTRRTFKKGTGSKAGSKATKEKAGAKTAAKGKKKSSRLTYHSSDDEEEADDDEEDEESIPPPRSAAPAKSSSRKAASSRRKVLDSDDEDD